VQLAFRFTSNGSSFSTGWYIDEVTVVTGAVAFSDPRDGTWESGLGDWSVDAGTWEVGTPTAGPDACHEPSNCAATVLDGNYGGSVDSRLISPSFAVPDDPEHPNPRLRFWHWFSFASGDRGEVQIRPEGGSWETISEEPYAGTGSGVWTRPSLDLTPYAGQTVQLAFRFTSNGSSFSTGWYIDEVTGNPPLPVEMTSFDAVANGSGVVLQWQTASETNNAGFDVEHGDGNEHWRQLGFVEGAGTTTEPQRYTYRISDLASGTHLFRLKQIDLDGAFTYSPEVEITVGSPARLALDGAAPNPVADQAAIRYELPQAVAVRLAVFDALGREVAVLVDRNQSAGVKTILFDSGRLPSGTYFVRLSTPKEVLTKQLTIVR
jgi:hypothetical protein